MRTILALCLSVFLVTSGTALAVKPDNPGGSKFDAEAAIQAETDARIAADADLQGQLDAEEAARIDGDAALQGQIDDILNSNTGTAPAVMYLRTKVFTTTPNCPEYWTEANYASITIAAGIEFNERTCYYCAQ